MHERAVRAVQGAELRRPAEAAGARPAGARHPLDAAGARQVPADHVVLRVRDEHLAAPLHEDVLRSVELRGPRGAAVTREPGRARPRDGADAAIGIDHAQRVPGALADVEPTLAV